MSKRLLRLGSAQIPARLSELLSKTVHIVLFSGKTYFGYLDSYTSSGLVLRDLRDHKHPIDLQNIEEIVVDHHGAPGTL